MKKEDGLKVLDLKGKRLSRVPVAVSELSEIEKLVLEENNLNNLNNVNNLNNLMCSN